MLILAKTQKLALSLQEAYISNAYIFNGIKGIGKATFVYRLARCILNKDNDLESIANKVINENIEPKAKSGQQEYLENILNKYI